MLSRRKLLPLAVLLPLACRNPLGVDTGRSQFIAADLGERIDVTLGNVGPAMYDSPPGISSDALTFLSVDVVPPYNPGGPNQRFRFRAAERGVAIVTFRRMLDQDVVSLVVDTVMVR